MERYWMAKKALLNIPVVDGALPSDTFTQVVLYADAQRALDALQAQLARWKEALGEWLWNCTNLLGDYHIKTVQDFNEEVNRRIAWLMQHLDYTLPPPMTDEERDRMRKLSEDNAAQRALDAEREKVAFLEKKNANLVEASNLVLKVKAEQDDQLATIQAQLRQGEEERDRLKGDMKERFKTIDQLDSDLTTLRQLVEALCRASERLLEDVIGTSDAADTLKRRTKQARATLAAQDAGKEDVSHE